MRSIIRSTLAAVVTLSLAMAWAPAALADSHVHTVEPGETLFRISLTYGVSMAAIRAANGIKGNLIYAGQRLVIPDLNAPAPAQPAVQPAAPSGGGIHIVQPGETLFRIGLKYGLPWTVIQAANGLPGTNVYAGQRLVIPGPGGNPAPQPATAPEQAVAAPEPPPASREQPVAVPEQPVVAQPAPQADAERVVEPVAPSRGFHLVQPGETLFTIGLKYGLSWPAIQAANGLSGTRIYTGQRLLIPDAAGSPAPAQAPAPRPAPAGVGKRFVVDLSEQRLYAYEDNTLVRTTLISSGIAKYPTVVGTYAIYLRYTSARMRGPGYDLPGVPYVMYFYKGYGLHGTYWHNNFGTPMSHGCVNMPTAEAEWAFNWSTYGTPVIVQW